MRVYLTNNLYSGNTNFQNPTKRKIYQPTFEGKPLNLPKMAVYGAYDAMVLYGFLKLGSYLDAGDDDISPSNKSIIITHDIKQQTVLQLLKGKYNENYSDTIKALCFKSK